MVPKAGETAAGQRAAVNPAFGTISTLQAPGTAPQQGGGGPNVANPRSPDIKLEEAAQGDIKEYEKGLRDRVDAYRNMVSRMNEQSEYIKNFQPGRYAGTAGGVAAAIKDIGSRLPGVDRGTVEMLARKLLGAEGPEAALAAQQSFEQLAQQETLAQLRSSLGENQRMNQAEYRNFANVNLGQRMDPETFNNLRKFAMGQAADAVNKYSSWADYIGDEATPKKSVTGFDARYTKREMEHYLAGHRSPFPGEVAPTAQPVERPTPSPVVPPAAPNVDLSEYESGARVGPTGKIYVLDRGGPRAARKLSEGGVRRISNREVEGRLTNE